MSIYDKGFFTVLAVSIVLILLAIPLALRKIPRNPVYGFRTRASMSGDELWFEANAYFGRGLVAASVCGLLLDAIVYVLRPLAPKDFLPASVLIMAVPLLVATLATLRHVKAIERDREARRLPACRAATCRPDALIRAAPSQPHS